MNARHASLTSQGAVVIGTSAGAVDALSAVLPALPAGFPWPVLVVVHLPPDRPSVLAELLQSKCRVPVREADDKQPLEPGAVVLAPPDYHLLVESDRRLSLSSEEPVRFSRPSIDVLFETAADAFDGDLVGIVLTGANADGARGLRAIAAAGGLPVVQSPIEAYASAMPAAALEACPQALSLTLSEIASFMTSLTLRV